MLTQLVESNPHTAAHKRRSIFFLLTLACYGALLSLAGAASIYAYDAHITNEVAQHVEFITLPPPTTETPHITPRSSSHTTSTLTLPRANTTTRKAAVASIADPTRAPATTSDLPNIVASIPFGNFSISDKDADGGSSLIPNSAGSHDGDVPDRTSAGTRIAKIGSPPPPATLKKKVSEPPASPRRVSKGVLNGTALELPKPAYTAVARQVGARGTITVQVVIDEHGRVVSAHAVDGHALLRAEAVRAALRARFKPTLLSGIPVSVQGVIKYQFTNEAK